MEAISRICKACKGKGTQTRRKAIGPQSCWPCNSQGYKNQTIEQYVAQEQASKKSSQKTR